MGKQGANTKKCNGNIGRLSDGVSRGNQRQDGDGCERLRHLTHAQFEFNNSLSTWWKGHINKNKNNNQQINEHKSHY